MRYSRILRKFRVVSLRAECVVLLDCGLEHLGIHFHLPGKLLDGVCAEELLRVEGEEALQLLIQIMELSSRGARPFPCRGRRPSR